MEKVTIKIPRNLYDKIRIIVGDSGFSSPTEFIVYVLRDLVSEQLADNEKASKKGGEIENSAAALTTGEIAAIKKRLKSLGYL